MKTIDMSQPTINFITEMVLWGIAVTLVSLIPLNVFRLGIFGVTAYTIALYLAFQRFTIKQLGFRRNFATTAIPWVIASIGMILAVLVLKQLYPSGIFFGFSQSRADLISRIAYYILFSAVVQEFVFRGYFFQRTKELLPLPWAIISTIIIFATFHLPYMLQLHSSLFYLSIIAGTIWTLLYAKYPNVVMAAASHSIVGAVALLMLQKF